MLNDDFSKNYPKENFNPWEYLGAWFGYPECCIEAFCNLEHMKGDDSEKRMFYGTGFVPCKSCADTKTEEQLRAEIAARRRCPRPFPLTDEECDNDENYPPRRESYTDVSLPGF